MSKPEYRVIVDTGVSFKIPPALGERWTDLWTQSTSHDLFDRRNEFLRAHEDKASALALFLSIEESRGVEP